jgi:hypothetical protein
MPLRNLLQVFGGRNVNFFECGPESKIRLNSRKARLFCLQDAQLNLVYAPTQGDWCITQQCRAPPSLINQTRSSKFHRDRPLPWSRELLLRVLG